MSGELSILNVGEGDTKLSFDKSNPAERIRASRIVTDMIRRGYALLVEIDQGGEKVFQRVHRFDEEKCEYIIADFDPTASLGENLDEPKVTARRQPEEAETVSEPAPTPRRGRPRKTVERAIPAESRRAVAVGRSAGG